MARLPKVGGDDGAWGQVLNDFLSMSHNDDGTIRNNTVGAAHLKPNAVVASAIGDGQVGSAKIADGAVGTSQIADNAVSASKLQDAGEANGIATLDGDGKLPDEQLPGRLGADELNAAIDKRARRGAPAVGRSAGAVIVFTFDDAPAEDYTVVKPILESRGVRGSFAMPSSLFGATGRVTASQVLEMHTAGHEILAHTNGQPAPLSEISSQIEGLVALGITPRGYVYSPSTRTSESRSFVRSRVEFAASGAARTAGIVNTAPLNTFDMARYNEIRTGQTAAPAKAIIDTAITRGELVIFYCHAGYDLDAAAQSVLGEVIDYALASGAPVLTLGEAVDRIGNQFDAGDMSGTKYTVVDRDAQLYGSGLTGAPVVAIAGSSFSITTPPSGFEGGKISVGVITGTQNGGAYPLSGYLNVSVNRVATGSLVYTLFTIIDAAGAIRLRRGTSGDGWGAWINPVATSESPVVLATANSIPQSAVPSSFAAGKMTVWTTTGAANTAGPEAGSAYQGSVTRWSDSSLTYTREERRFANGKVYSRNGTISDTWGSWYVVTGALVT